MLWLQALDGSGVPRVPRVLVVEVLDPCRQLLLPLRALLELNVRVDSVLFQAALHLPDVYAKIGVVVGHS